MKHPLGISSSERKPSAGSGRRWNEMDFDRHSANFDIDETSQYSFLFPKLESVVNRVD